MMCSVFVAKDRLFIVFRVFSLFITVCFCWVTLAIDGVVNKPVVDLSDRLYLRAQVVAAPARRGVSCCSRMHQALFNERVSVIRMINNHTAEVAMDDLIYSVSAAEKKPLNSFIISLDDVTLLSRLTTYQKRAIPLQQERGGRVVVLKKPWNGYSFGTRFVVDELQYRRKDRLVPVLLLVDPLRDPIVMRIPRNYVFEEKLLSIGEQRVLFVNLAYELIADAQKSGGVIPYVWGGCSYVAPYTDSYQISEHGWVRERNQPFYSGFDCSELVYRLARMVGSEYKGKVSSLAPQLLPEVPQNEPILAGDIIWMPGHIMIVGNMKNNEVIEARGYSSGFGCVHCTKVSKLFKNMKTCEEVRAAGKAHKSLVLCNRDGKASSEIASLKFLRLFDI